MALVIVVMNILLSLSYCNIVLYRPRVVYGAVGMGCMMNGVNGNPFE